MFVTGCHRSGTSLVASVLAALLPDDRPEKALLAPALDNPGGFHESAALVSANDALLSSLGASWEQPPLLPVNWCDQEVWPSVVELRSVFRDYALQRAWVDKDPRLAITAPAFQHILLRRPGIVVVLRQPLAVARSLQAREGWSLDRGLCLWWIYNLHLAAQLQDSDLVLCYEQMLGALHLAGSRRAVRRFFDQNIGVEIDESRLDDVLKHKCRPEWSRSGNIGYNLNSKLLACESSLLSTCERCFSEIQNSNPEMAAKLFRSLFFCLPSEVLAELSRSDWQGWPSGHCSPKDRQNKELLTEISKSKSWTLTAPMRWASSRFWRKPWKP